jgi:hypothetical protein
MRPIVGRRDLDPPRKFTAANALKIAKRALAPCQERNGTIAGRIVGYAEFETIRPAK